MGKNPISLYKKHRIEPHPRQPSRKRHYRQMRHHKDGEPIDTPTEEPERKSAKEAEQDLSQYHVGDVAVDKVETDARPDEDEETWTTVGPEGGDEDAETETAPGLFFGASVAEEMEDGDQVAASAYRTTKVIVTPLYAVD